MRGEGSDVVLVYEPSVAQEAAALARLLSALKSTGKIRRWGDVVLLLRSVRTYAKDYVEALAGERIPVNVVGEAGFFARDDITQLCNLFHFLGATKPWGDVYVRCALMGLGEETVEALKAYKGSLIEVDSEAALKNIGIRNPVDGKKILLLIDLKRKAQEKKHQSILSIFYELLAITGYVQECQRSGRASALMNLGIMSGIISLFDMLAGTRNLYPFQDHLQLLAAGGAESAQASAQDCVKIMTIHQAKGLEFPVVVLGSVMDGRLPSQRRRDRYEVPYDLRASGQPEVEDPHLTDERKLFYVGATRARELLILGTADVVNKRGGGPSPFLKEMLGDDIKAAANAGRARIREVESAAAAKTEPRERLSFSQLAYYLQCPVRFELAVVCGMQTIHPDPADFGANVHRALLSIHERALAGDVLTDTAVEKIVEDAWLSPISTTESLSAAMERDARKAAVDQLRRYVRKHATDLKRVEKAELAFSFRLQESVLLGRIDLIRKQDDGIEVVDFKTSGASKERADQEQVEMQLDIYSLGAEMLLGKSVTKQTAHFLGDGETRSSPWSAEQAARTRERLSSILDLVAARKFVPRTEFCARCTEFRQICVHAGGRE